MKKKERPPAPTYVNAVPGIGKRHKRVLHGTVEQANVQSGSAEAEVNVPPEPGSCSIQRSKRSCKVTGTSRESIGCRDQSEVGLFARKNQIFLESDRETKESEETDRLSGGSGERKLERKEGNFKNQIEEYSTRMPSNLLSIESIPESNQGKQSAENVSGGAKRKHETIVEARKYLSRERKDKKPSMEITQSAETVKRKFEEIPKVHGSDEHAKRAAEGPLPVNLVKSPFIRLPDIKEKIQENVDATQNLSEDHSAKGVPNKLAHKTVSRSRDKQSLEHSSDERRQFAWKKGILDFDDARESQTPRKDKGSKSKEETAPTQEPATHDAESDDNLHRNTTMHTAIENGETSNEKDKYSQNWQFTAVILGFFVGVSNLYFFPKNMAAYGGVCYLLPYMLLSLVYGFPIGYFETFIGQFTGVPPIVGFARIAPILRVIALADFIVVLGHYLGALKFSILIAETLGSGGTELAHARCNAAYNTMFCVSNHSNTDCYLNVETANGSDYFSRKNCVDKRRAGYSTADPFRSEVAVSEFYRKNIVVATDIMTIEDLAYFHTQQFAQGLITMLLIGALLILPIRYFAIFSAIIQSLTILLLISVVLHMRYGSLPVQLRDSSGIFYPNINKLYEMETWSAALNHVLLSYGMFRSEIANAARYSDRRHDLAKWVLLTMLVDFGVGFLGVIMSYILNAIAHSTAVISYSFLDLVDAPVDYYVLAVIPHFLTHYGAKYWIILYFEAIFSLSIINVLATQFHIHQFFVGLLSMKTRKWIVVGSTCFFLALLIALLCFKNSSSLLEWLNSSQTLLSAWSVAAKQFVLLGCYGAQQLRFDIIFMYDEASGWIDKIFAKMSSFARFCYVYVVPWITLLHVYETAVRFEFSSTFSNPIVPLRSYPLLARVLNPAVLPILIMTIIIIYRHSPHNLLGVFRVQPGLPSYQRIRVSFEKFEHSEERS